MLPKDGKPVTQWKDNASAFYDIEQGIRKVIDTFSAENFSVDDDIGPIKQPIRDSAETEYQPHELQAFEFEVATLNDEGQEVNRTRQKAQYFRENLGQDVWLDMVSIPGGSFLMGSPSSDGDGDEKPQHQVTVQPFFMGKFPVTQAQWRVVAAMQKVGRELELEPSHFKDPRKPVESVSWYDAAEFCQRLERHTGRAYWLPSEAEWEYACRAGTTTLFHFGPAISRKFVNCKRNLGMLLVTLPADVVGVGGSTTEVGSFNVANRFGLYDMHGNVWEWCADHWHRNYEGAPTDDTAWLSSNESSNRLLRGGSWYYNPWDCRSANRSVNHPDVRFDHIGFRVVCSVARDS